MKFRYHYFNALSAFILISFFLLMFLICAIDINNIYVWILPAIVVCSYIIPLLFLKSIVTINEDGITIEKNSKIKEFYSWDEIESYCDSCENRRSIIAITLKNGGNISLDNRKVIKNEIKKYCGDIPDFSNIGKEETRNRYNNYVENFINLSQCEFESVNSNTEHCVFCNIRTNKLDDKCYWVKKENRNFYICPKCYNDFKKYYRFKIKE